MRYCLREMRKDDIEAIIKGEEEIFGESLGYDYFIQELEINPFAHYIVLEINRHVCGYIGLWVNDNVEIQNFYVDKKYQNMGFGQMMMDFVIDVCKQSNVKNLSLEVRRSNSIARHLYEKYGLKEMSVRKCYYKDGEDAILMVREFEV